ncbi:MULTISPECIES: hypothetical protein [Mycolicibacterium]|uniref:Uncharacterized protein n=1 Tax=Mycolicibacterium alvei TaxID=67081 RepID=A0A6N4V1Z5_9MYCO|nr:MULTISPECIES: hypothetical protein [Mycolicibacterium]MCV6998671.1 hypothetical protein [Mycolicibacterium alvei]OBG12084.1 hypothetical protein A5768_11330 [Mycolicibacterium fortuitum]BBX30669.1 hypothetical protein MALV_57940 [Mycolicibacterium alvei]
MTSSEFIDDRAAVLDRIVRARSGIVVDLGAGRYRQALDAGWQMLEFLGDWRDRRSGWPGADPAEPYSPAEMPLVVQEIGLLSDLLFAAMGEGDSNRVIGLLLERLVASADHVKRSGWVHQAAGAAMGFEITVCQHNLPTVDPLGRCFRTPCPP